MINLFNAGSAVTYILFINHIQKQIRDSLETVDNPFESHESHFEATKKRKYKDRKLNKYLDDDPDIAAEQKRHGSDNVRIIQ